MRILLLIFSATLSSIALSAQKNGRYFSYSRAFENPDSVRMISIHCMHDNFYGTDGCNSIPGNIDIFKNLHTLHISETDIKTLPASIGNLPRLKNLRLYYNYSLNYEDALCKIATLDSLESLDVSIGNIKRLPDCLAQLKTLKRLDLSSNDLLDTTMFTVLKQLPYLETLDLRGIDSLKALPREISELKNLTSLAIQPPYYLDDFDYTSLSHLSSLNVKKLNLANNGLSSLPDEITLLKSLEVIDLSENFFDSLPPQFSHLINLKEIRLSNIYEPVYIDKDVQKLINLETIILSNCSDLKLQSTIENLSALPHLKEVSLDFRADTVPREIGNFKALEKLDIAHRGMDVRDLLIKLAPVKTLKNLDLSWLDLTTLPKEIGTLTNLEYLNLGLNPIESLPEEFFQLKKLKTLRVYGNFDSKMSDEMILKVKERLPNCAVIKEWYFESAEE